MSRCDAREYVSNVCVSVCVCVCVCVCVRERERVMILTVGWFLEVDVGVSEGATGDDVATDADGQDAACLAELLEQHGLVDIWVKVSHVERGDGVVGPAGWH